MPPYRYNGVPNNNNNNHNNNEKIWENACGSHIFRHTAFFFFMNMLGAVVVVGGAQATEAICIAFY